MTMRCSTEILRIAIEFDMCKEAQNIAAVEHLKYRLSFSNHPRFSQLKESQDHVLKTTRILN